MIQKSQKNLTFNSRSVVPLANLTPYPRFLLRERNLENANSRNSVTLINIEHLLRLKATAAPRIVGNILHFSSRFSFACFSRQFSCPSLDANWYHFCNSNILSPINDPDYPSILTTTTLWAKMFGLKVCRYKSPIGLKVLICKHRFSHQIVIGQAPHPPFSSHSESSWQR